MSPSASEDIFVTEHSAMWLMMASAWMSVTLSARTPVRIRNVSEGQAQSAFGTRATLRTLSVTAEVIDLKIS